MIDIWDPIELPNQFCVDRAARLQQQAGEYGVKIFARWIERSRLVTSKVELLDALPTAPAIADFQELTLSLAPTNKAMSFWRAIEDFAREVQRRTLAENVAFERVVDMRRKTHLVQQFRSLSVCGARGPWLFNSKAGLSCKACVRTAIAHVRRTPHELEKFDLFESEYVLVGEPMTPPPVTPSKVPPSDTRPSAEISPNV